MGTDIHMNVERRNEKGEWEWVKPATYKYEYKPTFQKVLVEPGLELWDDRNYNLFAILADVRNGSGFAGVDTGDPVVPIAYPRGWPDDLSPELSRVQRYVEGQEWRYEDEDVEETAQDRFYDQGFGVYDHTPSHLYLNELLAYDWDQPVVHRGLVNDYGRGIFSKNKADDKWKDGGYAEYFVKYVEEHEDWPEGASVCGGVSGQGADEYKRVQWTTPARVSINQDWFRFLDDLAALGQPEDVRIVFGFDS